MATKPPKEASGTSSRAQKYKIFCRKLPFLLKKITYDLKNVRDLTKINTISAHISALLTFRLKNDNNSIMGKSITPSDVVIKSMVFNHCKFFLNPKNVQFTIVYINPLMKKYPKVIHRNIPVN